MLKKILSFILLASCGHAQLPPTTLKPQLGAKATTFNFQAPFNQATTTAGVTGLIETGNTNILANPGFEATTYNTGWTASGGASSVETTNPLYGAQSYDWDSSSASQTLTSAAVTIPIGMRGVAAEVDCLIKTPSGTATHTIVAFDGTSNIGSPVTITSSTTATRSRETFTMPTSGTVALKLTSVNANEPSITIDDCFIGPQKATIPIVNPTYQVTFGNSGSRAAPVTCNTSPCVIYDQSPSGWVSSVTRTGQGLYTITFSGGVFSAAPGCSGYAYGNTSFVTMAAQTFASTSAVSIYIGNISGSATDAAVQLICTGPN